MAQLLGTVAVVLQKLVGHASRRADTHPGQTPQGVDQRLKRLGLRQCRHQKGIFMPGGNGIPAVAPAIFSCAVDSALRSASLNAAATKSSSISLSSSSKEGSIVTRRTSLRQLMSILTSPPPAAPWTIISASSS